jgi:hypothetical protein
LSCDIGGFGLLFTLLGFQSSPDGHEVYGHKTVSDDMIALLDYLRIPTVTLLGHDWYVYAVVVK